MCDPQVSNDEVLFRNVVKQGRIGVILLPSGCEMFKPGDIAEIRKAPPGVIVQDGRGRKPKVKKEEEVSVVGQNGGNNN
jgi:hypothetical protein